MVPHLCFGYHLSHLELGTSRSHNQDGGVWESDMGGRTAPRGRVCGLCGGLAQKRRRISWVKVHIGTVRRCSTPNCMHAMLEASIEYDREDKTRNYRDFLGRTTRRELHSPVEYILLMLNASISLVESAMYCSRVAILSASISLVEGILVQMRIAPPVESRCELRRRGVEF